jgi:sugar phosphate isomerase/epimerase
MAYSRREIAKLALAGFSAAPLWSAKIDSTYKGVRLGAGTGSFSAQGTTPGAGYVDTVIQGCTTLGIGYVELVNSVVEPRIAGLPGRGATALTPEMKTAREQLRRWRISTPLESFRAIRKKFSDAGITLISYVMTFDDDFPDEEIDAVFRQAEALSAGVISTNRTKVHMGKRLVPFAGKHKAKPAFHNHADINLPDEISTPQSMSQLLGLSNDFKVNLDIGWYHVAGFDPVAFIEEHHNRISHLHIKDRTRTTGVATEPGQGGTPIEQVLTLVKEKRYPIYCVIEREFAGAGTPLDETRKWFEYMKRALA